MRSSVDGAAMMWAQHPQSNNSYSMVCPFLSFSFLHFKQTFFSFSFQISLRLYLLVFSSLSLFSIISEISLIAFISLENHADLPSVFCLAIKRFTPYRKIENDVSIPSSVDFSPLLRIPSPSDLSASCPSQAASSSLYRLYGCVVHSGGLGGGHYISYCRSHAAHQERAGEEKGAEKWYYASDTSVSDVKMAQVKASQAYLVFYERVNE
jgi:hypothetical protein